MVNYMILDVQCTDVLPKKLDRSFAHVGPDADEYLASVEAQEDDPRPWIILFTRSETGQSATFFVHGYKPWLRIVSLGPSTINVMGLLRAFCKVEPSEVSSQQERLPLFYGFEYDNHTRDRKVQTAYKIFGSSFQKVRRMELGLQKSNEILVTDTQTPQTVKVMNDLGLGPSQWFTVEKPFACDGRLSSSDFDYQCGVHDLKPVVLPTVAPLKLISFDAEMYSHDNGFPSVLRGDYTVAICATKMIYGNSELKRHAFIVGTLERTAQIQAKLTTDMVVVACDDPQDLFEKFRDYLVSEDPDIVTGWNIFGFDMPFLWDEYKQAHLDAKLRGSEWLHSQILRVANMTQSSEYDLGHSKWYSSQDLIGLAKERKKFKDARSLMDAMPMRHRKHLSKSSELPECVASEFRKQVRSVLCLAAEPTFGGPALLTDLRQKANALMERSAKSPYGPTGPQMNEKLSDDEIMALQFSQTIDKPKRVGVRRAEYMSKLVFERSTLQEKRMASAAKGDNTYYYWSGRCCVDLMQIIKDDKKLDENSLKFAAQTFLDPEYGKLDMTAIEIFKAWRLQDLDGLARMLDYCARDADIPIQLIQKLSYVPIWIEMSRVTFTPLQQVLNGGQQRKVYNLIAHFVHNKFALNKANASWPISTFGDDLDSDLEDEDVLKKVKPDYQGATVIDPVPGFYTDSVSTLDFESLYPSIMIHFNLCPSVFVPHTSSDWARLEALTNVLEAHTITHEILVGPETYDKFDRRYGFIKTVQGVIPQLLQHLLKARKVAKRAMNDATNEFDRAVQNGRQLALKVSCNSVYGFFGVSQKKGLLSCKPVAAVTTLKGRGFIDAAKTYVEAHYAGSKVLYGDTDSIMINWGHHVSVAQAYNFAEEASAAITALLRSGSVKGATRPMLDTATAAVTLANEKVYKPYLLIQKKNYAGYKWTLKGGIKKASTDDDFDRCIDMKGIDAVRRDRSKLIKDLTGSVLDALLLRGSIDSALEVLRTSLMSVANQDASLDLFVLSKSLKSTYATENQPHVQAWRRMILRGDPDIPEIGTRMPFVVIQKKGRAGPLYEKTEHPEYVRRAKLPYDAKYYIENAQDVIERLLGPTGLSTKVRSIFQDALAKADQKSSGTMSLMSFLTKKPRLE